MLRCTAVLLLSLASLPAQPPAAQPPSGQQPEQDAVQLAEIQAFGRWLADYRAGAVRLMKEGRTDDDAVQKIDQLMAAMAKWNTLAAAKQLFLAASVEPQLPGSHNAAELVDFQREVQPWRVQKLAIAHLRTMDGPGIVPWLLGKLEGKGIRAVGRNQDQVEAVAVLRVLGGHPSIEAKVELLRACHTMPAELRVQAVSALADDATLETVPHLVELLRDAEANVRIAAAAGLGRALAPHVDESLGNHPAGELLQTRDQVIERLKELVERDKVWQVRSAAGFALASLKCKPVVPALIAGLKAELARKKDPWAMDTRLHKLLEGLTGQTVVPGDIRPWEQFWKDEGASFTVKRKSGTGGKDPVANKYQKFFDLEVDSDRVLFVCDFSGSMAEPVTLQGKVTGAQPGATSTKAELVVAELKKIVLGLPDNSLVNIVVFSDEVRCWREEGGRPALVKLDDDARDDLVGNFLDTLRPQGPTNIYGAMDKALDFAGRALYDKYYDAGFDTIYLITDGAPSAGEVQDKNEIRRRVREKNRLRRLVIHCVTFGNKNDTDFLVPMAEENGGRHIHIE